MTGPADVPWSSGRDAEEGFKARFGENVRLLRAHVHVSQEELASRADVHRTQISMFESGQRMPLLATAVKLAAALEVELAGYWAQVKAKAGLDFDFYHSTKHYGVHYMWSDPDLRMSPRAIAALAGWKVSTVIEMLGTYGHGDVGALEEVDAAFARVGDDVRHRSAIEEMAPRLRSELI
jgi:transcriptional regulator with XRE-family HTH domain